MFAIAETLAPEILGALSGGGGASSSIQPNHAAGGALSGVMNIASSLLGGLFGGK